MEDTVLLLFSDHTWYCAMKNDIDAWCSNHKWKLECYKAVIVIYPDGQRTEINLED